MDYDKLLNEWSEEIYRLMDIAKENRDASEFGSLKFYVNDGRAKGLLESLATLSQIEKKYKKQSKGECISE